MVSVSFFEKIDLELKRAKRYSVFVSILLVDLSFLQDHFGSVAEGHIKHLIELLHSNIRVVDFMSVIEKNKIGFLFPETPRQGAEIAAHRVTEIIRHYLAIQNGCLSGRIIPMEMASFPDAAGTKTIVDFLKEYTEVSRN